MSLAGRNWLGWTLNINVVDCYRIVLDLMADPRGRGSAGGGRHLFKQEEQKMLKKIIGGEG